MTIQITFQHGISALFSFCLTNGVLLLQWSIIRFTQVNFGILDGLLLESIDIQTPYTNPLHRNRLFLPYNLQRKTWKASPIGITTGLTIGMMIQAMMTIILTHMIFLIGYRGVTIPKLTPSQWNHPIITPLAQVLKNSPQVRVLVLRYF